MPRNDDGEFELILGNRQLMSVFFIVVILLGVFFAMGYIVGRNASPVGASGNRLARHGNETGRGGLVFVRRRKPRPGGCRKEDAPKEAAAQPKETASQQAPASKPAPPPEPVSRTREGVPRAPRPPTSRNPGRTYLQLSAIDHDKAEIMVELLRKKKFPAIAAEIPEKPGVFRVLVGPISDADINKTRADLQNASFPGKEAVSRRTFC